MLPDISIPVVTPVVTANAVWLMNAQHSEPGSPEDGKWSTGDTFRITVAMLDYYDWIQKNPIFVNNHPKVTPIYQLKFPPLG